MLDLAFANALSPAILSFVLGVAAAAARSDLAVPEAIGKGLALYLMFAIGFKGGAAMGATGLTADLALVLVAGAALSVALPLVGFAWLAGVARLDRVNAAAVAAHYGSVSVVTFVTAVAFLDGVGVAHQGGMVAVMALMETPAIVVGLMLARSGGAGTRRGALLREVLVNGSVVVLIGGFVIGLASGPAGAARLDTFVKDLFQGALCLFLLDMGLLVTRQMRAAPRLGPAVLASGIVLPLIGAAFGFAASALIGLDAGDAMLLITLAASASYIAVPAAMRLALPQADPAVAVTLSLGITFPFNVTVGIPLYLEAARLAAGG